MSEPSPSTARRGEGDEKEHREDVADLLIKGAWGPCLGRESPLCCPGWNFVLEKCLTFSNPNCTQQGGGSSFPLPTGLVSALVPGPRMWAGGWREVGSIGRPLSCQTEVKLSQTERKGRDRKGSYRYLSGYYPWHLGSQAATFKHMIWYNLCLSRSIAHSANST